MATLATHPSLPQAHQLAHPTAIATDGSGTVLEGERERYVVEFVDPGKRTAATVNLAGLGLDEGACQGKG